MIIKHVIIYGVEHGTFKDMMCTTWK